MTVNVYGDISPRTAAKASKELLKNGEVLMCLEQFGQSKPLGANETKAITWRRYNALDNSPNLLTEGVTPSGKPLTHTDITATLDQMGDYVELTDVVHDTHEDPVLQVTVDLLGTQQAEMAELHRFGKLKAGTNVFYANGATRNAVNTGITKQLISKVVRTMKGQRAQKITSMLKAGPNWGTEPLKAAYIAFCHTDLEADLEEVAGFVPVEKYATGSPVHQNEFGKIGEVRFITSSLFTAWEDAGGAAGGTFVSQSGTNADVYPILIAAKDSYGIVPLKGKNATKLMVRNPAPAAGDPLGQRGTAGWKCYQTAAILNDAWFARVEVAVNEL